MAKQKAKREPMRKLRAMRVLKGYTTEMLAQKTGLNRNTINQYETGKHTPRIDNLKIIAKVLECELSDIL